MSKYVVVSKRTGESLQFFETKAQAEAYRRKVGMYVDGGKASMSVKKWKGWSNPPRMRGKRSNPRGSVRLPRTGHTGFLKARAVDVITRGGRVVEVKVKR